MNLFFFIVEPLIYIGGGVLLFYKKDLAILYLPALFFAASVIVSSLPAIIGYSFFSFYIGFLIYHNPWFFRKNIFAVLLLVLHILLIPGSSDLVFIRPALFGVIWTLLLLPLAMNILEKYPRKQIFYELSNSVLIIFMLFLANVGFSTLFNYSPHEMYGMQSGVMYGELIDTNFNVLAIAVFIGFVFLSYKLNFLYLIFTLLTFLAIGLSMRRSVIIACVIAFIFLLLILLVRGQVKQVAITFGIIATIGLVVLQFTNFTAIFKERFEQRDLANREVAEEGRFAEYGLLYRDVFVHYDLNPWIGHELLNSGGNYGKGIFGDRTLHGDITNIIHSTGVIGLVLYLLMFFKLFREASRQIRTRTDKIIIVFCFCVFVIFTVTGRYTQTGYMTLLFLLLCLPMGANSHLRNSSIENRKQPTFETN